MAAETFPDRLFHQRHHAGRLQSRLVAKIEHVVAAILRKPLRGRGEPGLTVSLAGPLSAIAQTLALRRTRSVSSPVGRSRILILVFTCVILVGVFFGVTRRTSHFTSSTVWSVIFEF